MLLLLASSPDCTYTENGNTELTKTFKMAGTTYWVLNCSHGGTAQHWRLLWSLSRSNCTFTVFPICQTNGVQAVIVWALLLRLLSPTMDSAYSIPLYQHQKHWKSLCLEFMALAWHPLLAPSSPWLLLTEPRTWVLFRAQLLLLAFAPRPFPACEL